MAKFYGTLQGNRGEATRCGTDRIDVSAQSWDGSVIVSLWYKEDDLMVRIETSKRSTCYGDKTLYSGKFEDLLKAEIKIKKVKKGDK